MTKSFQLPAFSTTSISTGRLVGKGFFRLPLCVGGQRFRIVRLSHSSLILRRAGNPTIFFNLQVWAPKQVEAAVRSND